MASISKDASGNVTIQFVGGDKRRRSVRLGKINAKTANEVKLKVEHLNALVVSNLPTDADTARWVASIGDDLAAKLAAVGLIPERSSRTLGGFLDTYLDARKADGSKPATVVNFDTVMNDLRRYFGNDTALRSITTEQAHEFRTHYQTRPSKLAGSTVHRRLRTVRHLFAHALKLKLVSENPFAGVSAKNANPTERQFYVSEADTLRLIAAANPTWRTIVALARFGGLR